MPRMRRNRRRNGQEPPPEKATNSSPMDTEESEDVEAFDPSTASTTAKLDAGWATHAYAWAILNTHPLSSAHRDELQSAIQPAHIGRCARDDFKAVLPCPWSGLCRVDGQECVAKLFVVEDSECVRVDDGKKFAFYSIPMANADMGILCGNCFGLVTGHINFPNHEKGHLSSKSKCS
eukprot:130158_1